MPVTVTPAIPASQLVQILPSVLVAGGANVILNGLLIDGSTGIFGYPSIPLGTVISFADQADVASYFGPTSQESGLASVYFNGYDGATASPAALLMTGYAIQAAPSYLRGGTVSGLTLAQLQAINGTLSVTIDGTPVSQAVNLSAATSFSNAAELIGGDLQIKGIQTGIYSASLSTTTMTVVSVTLGPQQAQCTASLSTTTMTVSAMLGGELAIGQVVTGTGISAGTTIASFGTGAGGVGTYTLSASATTETNETVTAFSPTGILGVGQVVSGTGITTGTYIAALGTGTGGAGTYTLSTSATTESAEAVTSFAPGVVYSAQHGDFVINSGTTGAGSSVGFATGTPAATLGLTQATGAVQSPGAAAVANGSSPLGFMTNLTNITQNFASFMTTWEPIDADKESFALWTSQQDDAYVYEMWETNILDTESGSGPSAPVAYINSGNLSGIEMIYTNPNVTTLLGEKAAFGMGYTASLNFNQRNGRTTMAYRSQAGLQPDVINASVAQALGGTGSNFGYGVNFYGDYTTPNQAFVQWERGFVSGAFTWKDSYVNQIWLSRMLQNAIMAGLRATPAVPYNQAGNALIEAWIAASPNANGTTPNSDNSVIGQAVDFGMIVSGVQLSSGQIAEVNSQAGLNISQTLFQRGWYLQVLASTAPPSIRAARSSPSCTLWYVDGGSVQQIDLSSILIQ